MPFTGPPLDPVSESLTIWDWLFEKQPCGSRANAFIDGLSGRRISFQALKTYATLASISLNRNYGLEPGTKVAIVCRTSVWYPVALFAAIRLGAIVVPLPHEAKTPDYEYFLKTSGAEIVFVDESTVDQVRPACSRLNIDSDHLISVDCDVKDLKSIGTLVEEGCSSQVQGQVPHWQLPATQSNKKACAYLPFSSGTTGLPKAVMISHANVIAQCHQMDTMDPGTRETILAPLPFYHITGLLQFLHVPIMFDQDVVLLSKFNMADMMKTILSYKCKELWLVPPLLIRMVNEEVARKNDLSFVRQLTTGAAPLSPQVIEKLAKDFPQAKLRQAYGMTESCSCLTTTPKDLQVYANADKVGKLVPGTQVKVVDPASGKEVGYGVEGEIWALGPQVTMGYLNNKKATSETYDEDGYLHTGDLGIMRPDGFVTIHDRIKEMIKVKGHGVAPAELEDTLHGHEKVADVAVIGIPDEYAGEVPKAFVVLREGVSKSQETAQELEKHVEGLKARYMWLLGGVEFIDQIPKSAAGKIVRRNLREIEKRRREAKKTESRL